jgi:hypothetical protein
MNPSSDQYGIYYCKVVSMLSEPRYLIVITDMDLTPVGTHRKLDDIEWRSFQLRIINKEIKCPEVNYRKYNNGVFDDEINVIKRDTKEQKVIYQCKFNPLTVELLPNKKANISHYPDKSTLEMALDTFNCVIYF